MSLSLHSSPEQPKPTSAYRNQEMLVIIPPLDFDTVDEKRVVLLNLHWTRYKAHRLIKEIV